MHRVPRCLSLVMVCVILAGQLSACGFGSDDDSPTPTVAPAQTIAPNTPVTREMPVDIAFQAVSPEGEEVVGPDEATVEVPSGALDGTTRVGITTDAVITPPLADGQLVGSVYTVVADQESDLGEPLTVTVPVPRDLPLGIAVENLQAVHYDGEVWTPIQGSPIATLGWGGARSQLGAAVPSFYRFQVPQVPASIGWLPGSLKEDPPAVDPLGDAGR